MSYAKRGKTAFSFEIWPFLKPDHRLQFRKWHVRKRLYMYQRGQTRAHIRRLAYYTYALDAHYAFARATRGAAVDV